MKNVLTVNIHSIINLRGLRQQSFVFAFSKGMKGCYTKGCEIFTPIDHALKGVDVQDEVTYQKVFSGQIQPMPVSFIH